MKQSIKSWGALLAVACSTSGLLADTLSSKEGAFTMNLAQWDSEFAPAANGTIFTMVAQGDGKILVGGNFTTLCGRRRSGIGRLNADGTLEANFSPIAEGNYYPYVLSLLVQVDGKILVGGSFTNLGGEPRGGLGRLQADGTLDRAFNPLVAGTYPEVSALALQPDGKILVGGRFTTLGGQPRSSLGRVNADGRLDEEFNPRLKEGPFTSVESIAIQIDGKIIIAGTYDLGDGQLYGRVARFNSDGTIDAAFNPQLKGLPPYPTVKAIAVQEDGKILVGGCFTNISGAARNNLGRLNVDGTLDEGFNPEMKEGYDDVISLAVQANGKILVAGGFGTLGGEPRNGLGRLNEDGTLDNSFLPELENSVDAVSQQADGKILVAASNARRLNNPEQAVQVLTYAEPKITWLRGGSSPEIAWAQFDYSTNSVQWFHLGQGSRMNGGWQLSGVNIPSNSTIRAIGAMTGGYRNSSGGLIEVTWGMPLFTSQPLDSSSYEGTPARFQVKTYGSEPLSFQWYKDGVILADGDNITGAQQPILAVQNVTQADAGGYCVVVSNAFGAVTSVVARLTVHARVAFDGFWYSYRYVHVIAMQTDRKILLGGARGLWAIADQSIEMDSGPGWNSFSALGIQADGKILVGGLVYDWGREGFGPLRRLNPDGTLDHEFKPTIDYGYTVGTVNSLIVQADGKVLVGGKFNELCGRPCVNLGRLNKDGTLDPNFISGTVGEESEVCTLAMQGDGKILVGGSGAVLGPKRGNLGRLNADGTVDEEFINPQVNGAVNVLAVQADGKILVGGSFSNLGGQSQTNIGRLHPDGRVDDFRCGTDGQVYALGLQADGKILVGGMFETLGGRPRTGLGRLNTNGSVDEGLIPGADRAVSYSLAVQPDGKILMGRNDVVRRLVDPVPAIQHFSLEGSTARWLRAGSSPEIWQTTFEWSTNSLDWYVCGAGRRIPGGWELTNVFLPPGSTLRARGSVASGYRGASGWLVEAYWGKPVISSQPTSRTNKAGSSVSFKVVALGSEPLSFQWYREGFLLADGERITGVNSAELKITDLRCEDAGIYSVRVSNTAGSVMTSNASLVVTAPLYQVWGGNHFPSGSAWWDFFYTIPEQDYVWLGSAQATETFNGEYLYYVVRAEEPGAVVDAIQWPNGQYLEDDNIWSGNVTNPDFVLGHPDGEYNSFYYRGSFIVFQNPGSFSSLTIIMPGPGAPPRIRLCEQERSVWVGETLSLRVDVVGSSPLVYEWYKDGAKLTESAKFSGTFDSMLQILNFQPADTGLFSVVIKNDYGFVNCSVNVRIMDPANDRTPFVWARRVASAEQTDDELALGTTVDGQGNVYVTGWFDGSNNFGGTDLTSMGGQDGFLAKYNSLGSLAWVHQMGSEWDDWFMCRAAGVDGAGNVYVTGGFNGEAQFGGTNVIADSRWDTPFVAKYDSAGALRWVRQAGEPFADAYGTGIAVDAAGDCWVVGYFEGISFGELEFNAPGKYSIFVAKYDHNGAFQWARALTADNLAYTTTVGVDAQGHCYVAGTFEERLDLGGTNLVSIGGRDGFLVKYDTDGALQWARQVKGLQGDSCRLGVGLNGDCYIVGAFTNYVDFGGLVLTNNLVGAMYLAKYDHMGNLQWARKAESNASLREFNDGGCAVDQEGNCYIPGLSIGTMDFGKMVVSSRGGPLCNADALVAKYSPSGDLHWVYTAGGSNEDLPIRLAVDTAGNCHIVGWFQGTSYFGTNALQGEGLWNVFLAKLTPEAMLAPTMEIRWHNALPLIRVNGAVGDQYELFASPVLQALSPLSPMDSQAVESSGFTVLGRFTNQVGVVEFIDHNAPTNQNRFYRVRKTQL